MKLPSRREEKRVAKAEAAEEEGLAVLAVAAGCERLGTFTRGMNSWLRAVVKFDGEARSYLLAGMGAAANLGRGTWDGIAMGLGLAADMGLQPGDRVKVTIEKVSE